jgi:hypothetical protein
LVLTWDFKSDRLIIPFGYCNGDKRDGINGNKKRQDRKEKDIELCLIKDEMNVFVLYLVKLLR